MRILALVGDAYGGFGGISRYNRDLFDALAGSSHVEEIVILPRQAGPASLPAKVRQLSPSPRRAIYAVRAFALALFGARYDVIFCGHLFMAPLAVLIGKLLRKPVWLQVYGIDAWDKPDPLKHWAVERADLITSISRYTRSRLMMWAHLSASRIKVLPCTVDDRFSPGEKRGEILRRYKLSGKKILLTVGRLVSEEQYKGHEVVIKALAGLRNQFPDLVYVIAGDGDDRPRLEALVRESHLEQAVVFTGKFPDADLPTLYRVADVFIMPSTREGFGIVFLEAAASGLQVIGGNMDGSLDALADGEIGFCVNPVDVSSVASAITAALTAGPPTPNRAARFRQAKFQRHANLLLENIHVAPTAPV